jgi:hypothetical protein
MPNNRPNFYITEDAYRQAVGAGNWQLNDLPPAVARYVRPFLNHQDTLGVFACGTHPPQEDAQGRVAGIDWIRYEPEQHRSRGEGPLNFYAYIIKRQDETGKYPVYGPFRRRAISDHHGDLDDVAPYLE